MEVLVIQDLELGWDSVVAVLPQGSTIEDYITWACDGDDENLDENREFYRKMFRDGTLIAKTHKVETL